MGELMKITGDGVQMVALTGMIPSGSEPHQKLTVDNTVRQFAEFASPTTAIFWTNEQAECRVTFDGTDPTTTEGHPIAAGTSGIWSIQMARAAKFIRTTGTSAIIHASQMK